VLIGLTTLINAVGVRLMARVKAAGRQQGRRVAVGYDGRVTSPELEAALVDGLTMEGTDVVRIGRGPTPMLYYAAATLGVDSGVMVTGSHNPPDHNGFKFVFQGKSFYEAAIQKLGETAGLERFRRIEAAARQEAMLREPAMAKAMVRANGRTN